MVEQRYREQPVNRLEHVIEPYQEKVRNWHAVLEAGQGTLDAVDIEYTSTAVLNAVVIYIGDRLPGPALFPPVHEFLRQVADLLTWAALSRGNDGVEEEAVASLVMAGVLWRITQHKASAMLAGHVVCRWGFQSQVFQTVAKGLAAGVWTFPTPTLATTPKEQQIIMQLEVLARWEPHQQVGTWIGVTEAAQQLGLSIKRVYQLIDQGLLPAWQDTAERWHIDSQGVTHLSELRAAEPPRSPGRPPSANPSPEAQQQRMYRNRRRQREQRKHTEIEGEE